MAKQKTNKQRQIVVLGAGFAGLRTGLSLARQSVENRIIIVDHSPYHVYHPTLYEVATSVRSDASAVALKGTVLLDNASILKRFQNITFKQAWVKSIDVDRKIVHTDDGDLAYNGLVVALGSKTDFYDIPGLKEYSFTLKSFEDAVRIRNHVDEVINSYQQTRDLACLNFVVGGGGFTGIEFAAELTNYLKHLRASLPALPAVYVHVIEGAPQILPGLPQEVSARIAERLQALGVIVKTGSFITEAKEDGVQIGEREFLEARTIVWTGGVRAVITPFAKKIPVDNKDRVIVSSRLNLDSYPEVFVIGDCSAWIDPATNKPLAPTAQIALHQADYVARMLPRQLNDEDFPVYRPKRQFNSIVPVSGKYALVTGGSRTLYGFLPYVVRRMADLRYLLSVAPWWQALPFWLKGSYIYIKND